VKLIVGLGNPGPWYRATRHNIGCMTIEALAATHHIRLQNVLPNAEYGEGRIGMHQVVLAKPLTYMNANGKAVAELSRHFAVLPRDVIIIHDDLDLTLGRVKLKTRGGDAGHYGVRSVIEHLGTGEFTRIRIGIGRPSSKDEVVSFVLTPFASDELPLVNSAMQNAVEAIEQLLSLA
jgi:PTH1 family peptidyl-tRNA hydrolase